MASPPSFHPADASDTPIRLIRLETWAVSQSEFIRQHIDDYQDLAKRVNNMDTWKQEIVMAVGAMRLKIGWVMFLVSAVSGLLAAIITAIVNRVLG